MNYLIKLLKSCSRGGDTALPVDDLIGLPQRGRHILRLPVCLSTADFSEFASVLYYHHSLTC
jgi:hypothetical protein